MEPRTAGSPIRHIVISVLDGAGGVFPLTGIGQELLKKGYRVTMLTNPYFEDRVREAGLGFSPWCRSAYYWDLVKNSQLFGPATFVHPSTNAADSRMSLDA